ncbi:hypothetical protein D3C72_744520 [compost metagenome]
MRSKTTPVLTTVLFLALVFSGYYIYTQKKEIKILQAKISELQAGSTSCCGDSVVPTYSSISYEEFEQNVNYFKTSIGGNAIDAASETKSLWMSMDEMQNYLCVVRNHAKEMGLNANDLGLRIYFIRYKPSGTEFDNKLSVAFIPTYKSERGTAADYDATRLKSTTIMEGGQTFIMNRIMPCPVNCDGVLLK